MRAIRLAILPLYLFHIGTGHAAETDQYLVWGVELNDSADAVNAWLNVELETFLSEANSGGKSYDSSDAVAIGFMRHVFTVRPFAHINKLYDSGELDEFPPRNSVNFYEYQKMSIYRGPAFPFVLFMARTIRIGDVYLGIDKLSHFFGFGRRYFVDYLDLERRGLSEKEIERRLIENGLGRELWFTGRAINGVISPSDLEANYQGLRFALSVSRGPDPLLVRENGKWVQTRPIDIVPYITPYMDESYYHNSYWAARKRQVLPIIAAEYDGLEQSPIVRARFETYDSYTPSFNVQCVDELMQDGDPPVEP